MAIAGTARASAAGQRKANAIRALSLGAVGNYLRWPAALMLALALVSEATAGLPETPRLRQLTVVDGLPSNRINGMAEDRAGYLWIATSDGLARYDGVGFRTWRVEQGLHDNAVSSVHVDAGNRVWFGTHQAGLGVLDAQRRQFRYYHRDNTPAMASNDVSAVASTPDGAVWFGTREAGLYRIAADGRSVSRFMPRANDPHSLPSAGVAQLAVAPEGTLWVGTPGGAARWTGRDFERVPAGALASPAVSSLAFARDGRLWIGTPGGVSLRRTDGRYLRSPWAQGEAGTPLRVLSCDRSGQLWFDIPGGLGMGRDRIESVPLYSTAASGAVTPAWAGALEDHEGGLWFPSYDSGLWYLPANWRRFAVLSPRDDALANTHVRGIAPAADGAVWLVGSGGALDRLDPETGGASRVVSGVGNGAPLAHVFEDRGGTVWVSWTSGLARVHPGSGEVQRWDARDAVDAALPGDARFAEDGDGTIWMATDRRVQSRDAGGRVVHSLAPGQGGLPADMRIDHIGRGPDGAVWLAGSQGVMVWNAGARRFQSVPGAPRRPVYGFAVAPRGQGQQMRVWLARFGAVEAYRWDGAALMPDGAIDSRDGFPTLEPSGLTMDLAGRLWLTSVRGLIRIDPESHSVRIFGVHDGLPGQEFDSAPVLHPGDGRILASLNDGLVIFDPAAMGEGAAPPRLVIESSSALRGDGAVAFSAEDPIELPPDARDIRFVARLLSFDDVYNHVYRFRLEGYDNGWVETGPSGERIFSRLKPGHYRLQVQARAADNVWSPVQSVAFDVLPPWWRTWWAGAIFAALGGAVLWFAAEAYRQRLKRRHAWQLAQQKRELAEQASGAKTRFLALLGHEVRTPMTGVLGMSELLLGTPLNPQQRGYVGAIRGAGEHLLRLVNDALDLARIESGKLELADEVFDAHALMDELAALTGPLARQRGLAFETTVAGDLPRHLRGDAARVRQILLNLLGNAVKFTEQGRVSLAAVRSGEEGVRFEVADTGPGLTLEQKSRLFRRFEQAEGARTSARYGGSGLGLAISQELAAAMGGGIEVDSAPGEGTRFRVELPLPAAMATPGAAFDEAAATPARDERRSLSLLLVEDDPTVAEVLTGLLRLAGHHVVHVAHGLAALAAAVTTPFDAALLDLDLPGMDGLALARQLRIQGFARPLIAVTARADAGAEPEAIDAGFDYFVRKPMTLAMLSALLERAVPGHAHVAGQAELDPSQPVAF